MRRLHKAITALLVVLCIAGAAFAFVFLRKEQRLATQRQQEIGEVAKQLEPINEKRREWEKKDREWQTSLAEKQKGRTCVLLGFDNMSRDLYDTIFDLMDQYGFRGTFAMRNGRMPSWEMEKKDEYSSSEMMQEMLDSGWDYALSVGEEPQEETEETEYHRDFSEEFGTEILEDAQQESASEEEAAQTQAQTEAVQTEDEPETEPAGFSAALEQALARMQESGYDQPVTVFCTPEQYGEVTDAQLEQLGFTMVAVNDTGDFPVIEQASEDEASQGDLRVIDTAVYTQRDDQIEKQLDAIVAKQQSVAISINEVVKISQDVDYDLSLTSFTALLNYLKELEADRKVNVLTYSEYEQYEQLREESYETALAEYAAFREEMLAAIEELDMQEAAIARKLNETDAEGTGASETVATEAKETDASETVATDAKETEVSEAVATEAKETDASETVATEAKETDASETVVTE